MSNTTNSILFDRAREAVEYAAGKAIAQSITDALDANDLEAAESLVREVERTMFDNEFSPLEVY